MMRTVLLYTGIVALLLSLVPTASVYAAQDQNEAVLTTEEYYRENDVTFFGKDLSGSCGATGGGLDTGTTSGPLVGNDNIEQSYNYFIQKGLAPFQSAGIIGNLMQESGVNPNSNQLGGGPGRGIAQWTVNERWRDLQAFAQKSGRNERDLGLQLDFMWFEMNSVAPYNKTAAAMKATTTIEDAVLVFEKIYERAGKPVLGQRLKYANQVLERYGNGSATGSAPVTPGAPTAAVGGECAPAGGNLTGVPGETQPLNKGYTLKDNTDYTATPCAPGSTDTRIYKHPIKGFQVRLCKVKAMEVASIISDRTVAMVNDAGAAGVNLDGGGFRTYEQQKAARVRNGCPSDDTAPSSSCRIPTAPPGNGQHERGLAIDFSAGGTIGKGSPQFNWLSANAARYGFINFPVEPWHWSTSGS